MPHFAILPTTVFAAVLMSLPHLAGAQAATPTATRSSTAVENDYPTDARAEFVFACMNTNGGTQETLRKCSCAIDVIATIIPYDGYEKAETVLRMRRNTGGYLAQTFRVQVSNEIVRTLQEAEAEADVRCF